MSNALPSSATGLVVGDCVNASADRWVSHWCMNILLDLTNSFSFYSSQGRLTSFPDHNEGLIERLLDAGLTTLEVSAPMPYTSLQPEIHRPIRDGNVSPPSPSLGVSPSNILSSSPPSYEPTRSCRHLAPCRCR